MSEIKQTRVRSPKRFALFSLVVAGISIAVLGSIFYLNSRPGPAGKMESITVAYSPFEQTTLLWIAEDRDFFSRNGLTVTLRKYDTGAGSLDGTVNGETDVTIGVTEFPTVGRVLKKEKIRAIGSVAKLNQIYIIARKDRGIKDASDLKGKRVGTTLGTIAEFYLGRWLELHDVDLKDITVVDIKTPDGWVNAVANGEIDAIATAQPYANLAKERLGANAVVWPAQSGQPLFGLIVATDRWIAKYPELAGRLLESLAQAEEYAGRNPVQAKAIVRKKLNLDAAYMDKVWAKNQFSLSLDQSLVVAMEDQARWLIRNKITSETVVPNFLDYVHEDGLQAVKPAAVNIIR